MTKSARITNGAIAELSGWDGARSLGGRLPPSRITDGESVRLGEMMFSGGTLRSTPATRRSNHTLLGEPAVAPYADTGQAKWYPAHSLRFATLPPIDEQSGPPEKSKTTALSKNRRLSVLLRLLPSPRPSPHFAGRGRIDTGQASGPRKEPLIRYAQPD